MLPMILPAQRPLAWRQQAKKMGAELQRHKPGARNALYRDKKKQYRLAPAAGR
jgi:hypothetical protein